MADVPAVRRTKQFWELRLVSEFLSRFYPNDRWLTNVRVGTLNPRLGDADLTPAEQRMLGVNRPRADAIVIQPHGLVLIEGWILPLLGKVSQIATYRDLLPSTPELHEHAAKPITAFLLGPWDHALIRTQAAKQNIGFVVYHPSWIDLALASRQPRHREAKREVFIDE